MNQAASDAPLPATGLCIDAYPLWAEDPSIPLDPVD